MKAVRSTVQQTCETFASVSGTWAEPIEQNFTISRAGEHGALGLVDQMSVTFTAEKRMVSQKLVTDFTLKKVMQLAMTVEEAPWGIQEELRREKIASAQKNENDIVIFAGQDDDDFTDDEDDGLVVCRTQRRYILNERAGIKVFGIKDAYKDENSNRVERAAIHRAPRQFRPLDRVFENIGGRLPADDASEVDPVASLELDLAFLPFQHDHVEELDLAGISEKTHYRRIMAMLTFIHNGFINEKYLLDYFGDQLEQ